MIKSSVENSIIHGNICHTATIGYDIEWSGKNRSTVSPVEGVCYLVEEIGFEASEISSMKVGDRGETVDAEGYEGAVW